MNYEFEDKAHQLLYEQLTKPFIQTCNTSIACQNTSYLSSKERSKLYRKQYYEEHKEQDKKYREENKQRIAEYQKKYREENKQKIAERNRVYYKRTHHK